MKVLSINNIEGDIIKDTSTYLVKDNKVLKNLVVSRTFLRANKSTNGHRHIGQEEVYFFIKGHGEMEVDYERFKIKEGDLILIEDGEFHQVFNTGHLGLYFICIFNGERYKEEE